MVSATLTLSQANTVYNLYDLLSAARPEAPKVVAELYIIADNANSGSVYVGDSTLSTSNYGAELAPGDPMLPRRTAGNQIALDHVYLMASAANQKVNVTVAQAWL
jgi:hypothetical protein